MNESKGQALNPRDQSAWRNHRAFCEKFYPFWLLIPRFDRSLMRDIAEQLGGRHTWIDTSGIDFSGVNPETGHTFSYDNPRGKNRRAERWGLMMGDYGHLFMLFKNEADQVLAALMV